MLGYLVVCFGLAAPLLSAWSNELKGPGDSLRPRQSASNSRPPSCDESAGTADADPPAHCQFRHHRSVLEWEASDELLLGAGHPSLSRKRMDEEEVDAATSLLRLLSVLVQRELRECLMVLVADDGFVDSLLLDELLRLPNHRQVVHVRSMEDLLGIVWQSQQCRGYLLMLQDPTSLLSFADNMTNVWDYSGRFLLVGLTRHQLLAFMHTKKGRKTQHIVGVVQGDRAGDYAVLRNLLYQQERLAHLHTWRAKSLVTALPVTLFPDKTRDLEGAILNVVTFPIPPSVLYQRADDGSLLRRLGHDVELVRTMAHLFNFSVRFKEPQPGEMWGELTANGTWNGMVGLLGRGEADIGVANLFITALGGRRQFQEFTRPYDQEVTCYLMRREALLPRWQSLALPFRFETWLALLLGLLLSGPLLYCLASLIVSRGEETESWFLASSFLYTYGMHCREPQSMLPTRTSLRLLILSLWFYVIIITTGYSCNLTAFLTVERKPPGIKTLKDLYHSRLQVFGLGPFFGNSMAQSTNEFLRGLAGRFVSLRHFQDITSRVLKGQGVMIQSRRFLTFSSAQLTSAGGRPLTRIMQECFLPFNVAMGLQSHSPLKRNFDRVISWVVESGLVNYWFKETLSLSKQSKREEEEEEDGDEEGASLQLEHVQGAFFILLVGLAISLFVFLLEVFFDQRASAAGQV